MKKCPVYKCMFQCRSDEELEAHYNETHQDLIKLGLSMGQDAHTGKLGGCIKDTLLTQIITFAITDKDHFRYFQSDYQEDEANGLRKEIRKLLN